MRILLALTVLFLASCSNITSSVDKKVFENFGGTFWSSPNKVTMKEIHLDNGSLLGQSVMIEGSIVEIGNYTTYLVLSDESARMLVVLTSLIDADKVLKDKSPKTLRVLGIMERGKKGLPYVTAKALSTRKS